MSVRRFCLFEDGAYHIAKGNVRKKILIPDSAHGTNPASVTLAGYQTVQIKSNENGIIGPDVVAEAMDEETAGLMLTNPNTLGLFESNIAEIADIVKESGYLSACSTVHGIYNSSDKMYWLNRIITDGGDNLEMFKLRLNGAYDYLNYARRIKGIANKEVRC